jgi:hypothetical protein
VEGDGDEGGIPIEETLLSFWKGDFVVLGKLSGLELIVGD